MADSKVVPVDVPGNPIVSLIACGPTFSACYSKDGKVFIWGKIGDLLNVAQPSVCPSAVYEQVMSLMAGSHFLSAQTINGKILSYGINAEWGIPSCKDKKGFNKQLEVVHTCDGEVRSFSVFGSTTVLVTAKGEQELGYGCF